MKIGARGYEPDDLGYLQRLAAQPSVRAADALPVDADEAVWRRFIEARHNAQCRMVIILAGDAAAGFINITNWGVPEIHQIGYCVDEAYQGRGVASQAVAASAAALFESSHCQRLQATVEPHNAPSISVLEKCGFRREGLMRRGAMIGDRLRDVYLYAALKGDAIARTPNRDARSAAR